jgi:hypothetical protein
MCWHASNKPLDLSAGSASSTTTDSGLSDVGKREIMVSEEKVINDVFSPLMSSSPNG